MFLVRFVGDDTGARAEGDPQVKNTLKQRIWGKMLVRTWRCLKAAVSWVMCRVRHLDVHLALLVFSWTSSCSGELLRAQVTANIAQSSTKPARRTDITPEANTNTYTTTTKRFFSLSFPLVSKASSSLWLINSEWKHPSAARACARVGSGAPPRTLPPPVQVRPRGVITFFILIILKTVIILGNVAHKQQ